MKIAKVEPLTTSRALRGPFDYKTPEDWAPLAIGNVLRVPFGRRHLIGVVTGLAEKSDLPDERLAEPTELVSEGPPPELIELALWLAAEYVSTPARALGLVMPPGTGSGGVRVRRQKVLEVTASPAGRTALDDGTRLGSLQRAVLQWLGDGLVPASDLVAIGADRAAIRRLEARGLVETHEVDAASRRPAMPSVGAVSGEVELNPEQLAAVDQIVAAIGGKGERELLLHGVTGSGKTEVYLAAARAALDLGRGAIMLVPEIALTPQAVARFRARLGDGVAVLHSGLKPTERFDEWQRLRSGEALIAVGPRSAVFAPLADPALIVIDEEHEPSYKQEGDPRYDARAVARRRAQQAGAALLVGTATPRPESWLQLERIELPNRVDDRSMPTVEILDMRGGDGRRGPLHARTREELAQLVEREGKAMVLLNRRGWSPHVDCGDCGHVFGCPSCDVSLVHHSRAGIIVCHHCGHSEPTPRSCPECGSVSVASHGAGTEQIEALLERELAPLPVFRLDADTARLEGSHAKVLRRFQNAASGALVGTQMIAKGHDFDDVDLGVVLDADSSLRFPDFRAEERTFSLVTQLAGRVGRGEGEGLVLVQTLSPNAESIRAAALQDAAGFLGAELERRQALRYPPYSNLIQIELGAPTEAEVERAAKGLKEAIAPALPEGASILGPAPLFRRRDLQRRRLVVKTGSRAAAIHAVRGAVEGSTKGLRGIQVSVDVDPQ